MSSNNTLDEVLGSVSVQTNPENPWKDIDDGEIDPTIPSATLEIYKYINERNSHRETNTNTLRGSAANMCVRRRWYTEHGFTGTPLTPRKLVNFRVGDIGEMVVVDWISKALVGEGKLYSEVNFGELLDKWEDPDGRSISRYKQLEWSFALGDKRVVCHPDGVGKRNSDGKWELIEIKTYSSYGFDEFKRSGPGDYLRQAHANMITDEARALGVDSVRFYALKKETGHLWDSLWPRESLVESDVFKDYHEAIGDAIPDRPYEITERVLRGKPTGELVSPWQCNYCPYQVTCWKDEYTITKEFEQKGQTLKPKIRFYPVERKNDELGK